MLVVSVRIRGLSSRLKSVAAFSPAAVSSVPQAAFARNRSDKRRRSSFSTRRNQRVESFNRTRLCSGDSVSFPNENVTGWTSYFVPARERPAAAFPVSRAEFGENGRFRAAVGRTLTSALSSWDSGCVPASTPEPQLVYDYADARGLRLRSGFGAFRFSNTAPARIGWSFVMKSPETPSIVGHCSFLDYLSAFCLALIGQAAGAALCRPTRT
jgi:hypothetical protein